MEFVWEAGERDRFGEFGLVLKRDPMYGTWVWSVLSVTLFYVLLLVRKEKERGIEKKNRKKKKKQEKEEHVLLGKIK